MGNKIQNTENESQESKFERFIGTYRKLAQKCKDENRMLLNHVCIRVEDLDATEQLLAESFGINDFLRPGGKLFKGEKELSVTWINDEFYLELTQPKDPQTLGYDSGSQPIGHLSEVGFFVPKMEDALSHLGSLGWHVTTSIEDHGARMCKIEQRERPSGFPVELIDVEL